MKEKKERWKIGDVVCDRVIKFVQHFTDEKGNDQVRYGYLYENEDENRDLLFCTESTLLRKFYYSK